MSFIHSLDANVVARNRRSSGGTAREGRSGSKLRSIQILRGIAAMAVIAHHAFVGDTKIGAAGVDLFFVISGFIMSTCARDRHAVEFLTDRAWRIYPLWLIAVVPWLFMEHESLLGVVASITLWPVFGNELFSPALGVGWTLSFELLFYGAFALALATRPAVSIALYALCLILGLATNQLLFWFLGSPLGFEFLLGVAVARTPPRQLAGLAMIALALIWLMLSPAAFFGQAFGYGAVLRVFAWGMPAAMLLYGARSLEEWFVGGIFDMPVLIGSASYSIYLFHQLVLKVASGFVGFVASVMAGIVMYLVLERHIMRARLGLWVRRIRHWQGPAGTPVLDPQAKA